ncbi:MAG: hypothetical protein R2770_18490 [Acidimicrobiales bacterium]|nr:hypothetical protein [Acidimicrobiales bacterium]
MHSTAADVGDEVTPHHQGRSSRRTTDQTGSALLLIPAGIVIVLALGAMTLNASVSYMAERSAASLASEVANDVATLALDQQHFRRTGEYQLVADLAGAVGWRIDAARGASRSGLIPGSVEVTVSRVDATTVEVVVTAEVRLLLRTPGGESTRSVSARAMATASPPG